MEKTSLQEKVKNMRISPIIVGGIVIGLIFLGNAIRIQSSGEKVKKQEHTISMLTTQQERAASKEDATENATTIEEQEQPSYTIQEKVIERSNDKYSVQLEYPQIEGLENNNLQKKLNQQFKPNIEETIDFLTDTDKKATNTKTPSWENQVFKVRFNSTKLLSINFTHNYYMGGAAHSSYNTTVVNYDIESGEEIELSDLFTQASDYVERLSQLSTETLSERFSGRAWQTDGVAPKRENFENFVLTEDSLVIIYEPYQVASFADGYQEVSIPYEKINDIIDVDGPLKDVY